jgi:putative transcriptional regulator
MLIKPENRYFVQFHYTILYGKSQVFLKRGDCMALAENIKSRRIEKGLTQEELSGIVGVSRRQISTYEAGERIPDLYSALRIAKALGTTVEKLAYGKSTKKQIKN